MSAFVLSIGTSLAMESLSSRGGEPYDPDRKIPEVEPISNFDQLWVNVATLMRNMHASIDASVRDQIPTADWVQATLGEIETIEQLIAEVSLKPRVVPYVSEYAMKISMMPNPGIRRPVTVKQKAYYDLYAKVVRDIVKKAGRTSNNQAGKVRVFHSQLKPDERCRAMMLTHVPFDLLAWPGFKELVLLESHTGVTKGRNEWHTKLVNGHVLQQIPFTNKTLQIFGDHVMFKPMPTKAREKVREIADKCKWSWATTEKTVVKDLDSNLRDRLLMDVIKRM